MKLEMSQQILEEHSNTKFHENSSIGSRLFHADGTEGQIDMANLIVASRNFTNASVSFYKLIDSVLSYVA
jgi:hypothetical protein